MSNFNFGSSNFGANTGGYTFGVLQPNQQNTQQITTTTSSGFQGFGTGFGLGGTGFSFTGVTSQPSQPSGFGLFGQTGNNALNSTNAKSLNQEGLFNSVTTTQQTAVAGVSNNLGFSFGGAAQNQATTAPLFGGFGTLTAATTASGFANFGLAKPNATLTQSSMTGFSGFGLNQNTNLGGFGSINPITTNSTSMMGFGNQSTPAFGGFGAKNTTTTSNNNPTNQTQGFSFGLANNTQASTMGFGLQKTGFGPNQNINSSQTQQQPTTTQSSGFNFSGFGAKPVNNQQITNQNSGVVGFSSLSNQSTPQSLNLSKQPTTIGFNFEKPAQTGFNLSMGGQQQSVTFNSGAGITATTGFFSNLKAPSQQNTSTLSELLGSKQSIAPSTTVTYQSGLAAGFQFGKTTTASNNVATSASGLSGLLSTTTQAQTAPSSTTTNSGFNIPLITGGFGIKTSFAASGSVIGSIGLGSTVASGVNTVIGGSSNVSSDAIATSSNASANLIAGLPPIPTYSQMEDLINRWSLELQDQERIFLDQATQVNAWDRVLIDNADKIGQLNSDVERVKISQSILQQDLDFILAQQNELEDIMKPLESIYANNPHAQLHQMQHADIERENLYKLSESIDGQLKSMASNLKEIIEHINAGNDTQDSNDSMHQISKILNAHMDSLQWIDRNTDDLQKKLDDLTKTLDTQKKISNNSVIGYQSPYYK